MIITKPMRSDENNVTLDLDHIRFLINIGLDFYPVPTDVTVMVTDLETLS